MYLFYRHTAGVFSHHRNKIPSALVLRPPTVLIRYAKFTLLRRVFEANPLLGSDSVFRGLLRMVSTDVSKEHAASFIAERYRQAVVFLFVRL
jgi:hypothetical protein